jgi:hypothetical protein
VREKVCDDVEKERDGALEDEHFGRSSWKWSVHETTCVACLHVFVLSINLSEKSISLNHEIVEVVVCMLVQDGTLANCLDYRKSAATHVIQTIFSME